MDAWIKEAKKIKAHPECGMYLFHNGIVRQSAKAKVRQGDISASDVKGMVFSYDKEKSGRGIREHRICRESVMSVYG